jgi:hypothetical protein
MKMPPYRSSVLASHAFRRTLPARVLRPLPEFEPEVVEAIRRSAIRSKNVDWKHIGLQDIKDFLLAYCACFLAVSAFIS